MPEWFLPLSKNNTTSASENLTADHTLQFTPIEFASAIKNKTKNLKALGPDGYVQETPYTSHWMPNNYSKLLNVAPDYSNLRNKEERHIRCILL